MHLHNYKHKVRNSYTKKVIIRLSLHYFFSFLCDVWLQHFFNTVVTCRQRLVPQAELLWDYSFQAQIISFFFASEIDRISEEIYEFFRCLYIYKCQSYVVDASNEIVTRVVTESSCPEDVLHVMKKLRPKQSSMRAVFQIE